MLKWILLSLFGVCLAQREEVRISYQTPYVKFTLPVFSNEVSDVTITYSIRGDEHKGRAVHTSEGWEHRVLARLDGTPVHAHADLYDQNGDLLYTTIRSSYIHATAVSELPSPRRVRAVIFHDDFNSFNKANWNTEVSMFGGMNWEFQVYTPLDKNIFSRNGNLFLKPTLTIEDSRFPESALKSAKMDMTELFGVCTNSGNYGCTREGQYGMLPPIMSGKVWSVPTIRYGTVEVRAKIPRGAWIWPAIWMMPKNSVYGTWPRSGEIDIMESRGNCGAQGVYGVSSTLHWGPAWDNNRWDLTHGEKQHGSPSCSPCTGSWHDDFHTWRLEWTADHIITFVDNQQIMRVDAGAGFWQKGGFSGANPWSGGSKMAPFDQDFFLILNVAVGGTNGYFADNGDYCASKPWPNNSPHANEDFWNARSAWQPTWVGDEVAMQVDYVEFRN